MSRIIVCVFFGSIGNFCVFFMNVWMFSVYVFMCLLIYFFYYLCLIGVVMMWSNVYIFDFFSYVSFVVRYRACAFSFVVAFLFVLSIFIYIFVCVSVLIFIKIICVMCMFFFLFLFDVVLMIVACASTCFVYWSSRASVFLFLFICNFWSVVVDVCIMMCVDYFCEFNFLFECVNGVWGYIFDVYLLLIVVNLLCVVIGIDMKLNFLCVVVFMFVLMCVCVFVVCLYLMNCVLLRLLCVLSVIDVLFCVDWVVWLLFCDVMLMCCVVIVVFVCVLCVLGWCGWFVCVVVVFVEDVVVMVWLMMVLWRIDDVKLCDGGGVWCVCEVMGVCVCVLRVKMLWGCVYFVGGVVLGSFLDVVYDVWFSACADDVGFVVVATSYELDLDYEKCVMVVKKMYDEVRRLVCVKEGMDVLCVLMFWVGYSLGCKLLCFVASAEDVNECEGNGEVGDGMIDMDVDVMSGMVVVVSGMMRGGVGNVVGYFFVVFNNVDAIDSVKFVEKFVWELLKKCVGVVSGVLEEFFKMFLNFVVFVECVVKVVGLEFKSTFA